MNIKIQKTDGPSRTGEIIVDKEKIRFPNIIFIDTNRFKNPKNADLILREEIESFKINDIFIIDEDKINIFLKDEKQIENDDLCIVPDDIDQIEKCIKNNKQSKIFIVSNALQLFQKNNDFVDYIVKLREEIGYKKQIYLPGVATPDNIALLSYLGIDLFDNIQAVIAARNNILLFTDNKFFINELKYNHCTCKYCMKNENISKMGFNDILNHNNHMFFTSIRKTINMIYNNNLRNFIERNTKISPHNTSILRILDLNKYDFLEKRTSIISDHMLISTCKESLSRPDIKRFQNRIMNRYNKPESAKILLLLPCSSRKPYSFSKSHSFFIREIKKCHNPHLIHEMIITSPIGLVPRELELIYPVSSYDIPVTGIWDFDEQNMIKTLISCYLKDNSYDEIILHLPNNITFFLKDVIKNPVISCVDHPTSKKSTDKLGSILRKHVSKYDKIKASIRKKEDMLNIASYQFGREIAERLVDNSIIKGKYPYIKIMDKKGQIGMTTLDRGYISLTLQGAEILHSENKFFVEISPDFNIKGDIFAPGVINADPDIRSGDEVTIIRKNNLVGVGVAMMNGDEMIDLDYGISLKTRHILK